MGRGFRTNGEKVGWKNDVRGRERAYAAKAWTQLSDEILAAAERLRGVQIESRPASYLIPRFNGDNVLIYCDPPYLLNLRHGKQYRYEMSKKEHCDLLDVLLAHRGPVVLSGYESELYNSALHGWHKEYKTAYSQAMEKRKKLFG